MKSKEIDMCNGSLWKSIFVFSIPLMFSNLLQIVFNMTDVAVVGKFAGSIALGSVGSTSILISLYTGLVIGLGSSVNAVTALYLGAKNNEAVKQTIQTAFIMCLTGGLIIMTFGIISSEMVLNLLGTKDELIDGALIYLRVYLCGMPALGIYNFGSAVLSASGDTKRPLYYLSAAGVINLCLNLLFVIAFKLSVVGVALSSVIAQYISAGCIVAHLVRVDGCCRLSFVKLKVSGDKLKLLLKIGIPSALQFAIFALANLFVQASVNSFDHIMVEGNSAAANADALVYDMMAGFYTACSSFIAQNYGAKKRDRIIKSYLISVLYSFLAGFILGMGLLIFRTQFLYLFTNDYEVVKAGERRLALMAMCYCVSAFMDCTIAASRGLGKSFWPMIFVVMGSCVFRIIWIYTIFAHFRTIESLYLLYVFSWIFTAIVEITYFLRVYGKTGKMYQK